MIVEPVDENGNAAPPGTPSKKIYLTNLYNTTLPLMRYELTDEITVIGEACLGASHNQSIR